MNYINQVRTAAGLCFSFRTGTVDEIVLKDAYQDNRFAAIEFEVGATTIVDVGAHIGAYSIAVAARIPGAVVHAIEPSRDSYRILAQNARQNELPNIRLHNIALSDTDGEVALYNAPDNWGHSVFTSLAGDHGCVREIVPSQTLRTFMRRNSIATIDHLKMNAEGAEYLVILGADICVLRNVSSMLVEFHPMHAYCGEQIADKLIACDFEVRIDYSQHESGKGWITARQRSKLRD